VAPRLRERQAGWSASIVAKVLSETIGTVGPDTVGFMPDAPDGIVSSTTIQFGGIYSAGTTDHQTKQLLRCNANGWVHRRRRPRL
jgi:hypothetical protein